MKGAQAIFIRKKNKQKDRQSETTCSGGRQKVGRNEGPETAEGNKLGEGGEL